jgi:SAM-dependent methyltransferase
VRIKVPEIAVNTAEVGLLESQLRQRFNLVEQRLIIGQKELSMLHPRSADDLIDEEAFNRDERLPYWAEIWPSAYVLAQQIAGTLTSPRRVACGNPALSQREKYKEGPQETKKQPRLLELGCGCGLAVMAGLAAGYCVTAVDYYPEALDFVRLNAARNNLPQPETKIVDWRNYPADLAGFDLVVAADVLYERDYCWLIAAAMRQSLLPGGLGLITDPQRGKAEALPDECRRAGLNICKRQVFGPLNVPGGDPDVCQRVNLFEIRRAEEQA